jgi:hypothetical protein
MFDGGLSGWRAQLGEWRGGKVGMRGTGDRIMES